ncbi:alpha/beta hydrolase [Aquimarina pacifica]|uniref:alpha/beta hydrolase n=1 Tax=Aquimarina pacifica TaxID=1296415 RepID=UPI000470893B|nr:alpha/beta hydrolase [Aquimarina pacifica]
MNKKNKDLIPVQSLLIPKPIIYIGKILSKISPTLALRFAAGLFLTPFGYKMPKREKDMYDKSKKERMLISKINREIIVYTYGVPDNNKKVLLVHGWSGSGTQLSKIAETLINNGYSTVSFDAPAHGKSPGKRTMLPHFVETIHEIEQKYGPFETAIGHSLGGMALLRASNYGLRLKSLVIIGTANSITQIIKDFAQNMQFENKFGVLLKSYFDKKFGENLDNYSGAVSAKGVKTRTLVIHDKNDVDVHYDSAYEISDNLEFSELLITKGLGHRKILGDKNVISKILSFILE